MPWLTWERAWQQALYGPEGFYRRQAPAAHFRTSVNAGPVLGAALAGLARACGLERVVDIGSGRGELLAALRHSDPDLMLVGVDVVDRPPSLPAGVAWVRSGGGCLPGPPDDLPEGILEGALVVAHEWLDDVPCPVVERDDTLTWRQVEVEVRTGRERLGAPAGADQSSWLDRWWVLPDPAPGDRAEVGLPRDVAWGQLVARARGCVLLAVDYVHAAPDRPARGTLIGYRDGLACEPVPDGSADITAHVAIDAVAAAGVDAGAGTDAGIAVDSVLTTQRSALRALGVTGALPAASGAAADPAAYLAALSQASLAVELLDPGGLGGFGWLLQSTGPVLAGDWTAGTLLARLGP